MSALLRRRSVALVGFITLVGTACIPLIPTITTGTYRIGPFNLAAMNQPGWENEAVLNDLPRPPGDVGIKSMKFDLVDANNTPIPRMDVHLHHVLLMNAARTSPICPGEVERFAGAGAERTSMDLPGDYAYHSASTDRWNALWHIMNMSAAPKSVYIQYKVSYVPASDPTASRPVTPFFMDVTGCGTNAMFDVAGNGGPGSVFTKTRTITFPWNAVAVYDIGHLHDGGIDISIKRNSTGTVGCTSVAKYDMPEPMNFPSSITPCALADYVYSGETYTLTARYDNSMPHSGVMGIMLAYLWKGAPPPS